MRDESAFAKKSLRSYYLYLALAEQEAEPAFKKILAELAHTTREQFDFWGRKSGVRGDAVQVPRLEIFWLRILRKILGISTVAERIIGRKQEVMAQYEKYCTTCTVDGDMRALGTFTDRLSALINALKEARKRG